jgi:hypothetical protein
MHSDAMFLSLALGFIGMGLFIYGKKQSRLPQLIAGAVFMIYPYLVTDPTWMLLVGLAVAAGLWVALRMGW